MLTKKPGIPEIRNSGATMSEATINGVRLHYEVQGDGFPLIFCHEFAGSGRSWNLQSDFFRSKYRVITYNARGYPPSGVPADPSLYRQEHAIEDLRGLLDHLGIKQAHVAALSMGSSMALNFALAHPQRARSLALAGIGTGSVDAEVFRARVRMFADRVEKEGMSGMAGYPQSPERVQLLRKSPERWREFHDQFMNQSPAGTAMILRGVLGMRPTIFELETRLRALDIPSLVLVGDEDTPCLEPSLFLKRTMPRAGLAVFPRSGHTINLEEPELFNRLLMEFLNSVERGDWAGPDEGIPAASLAGQ